MSQADPILWGLASMFCWGTGDVLGRYAAVRAGSPVVAMLVQSLGVLPPFVMGASRLPGLEALTGGEFLLFALFSGLLFSFGYVMFYRGMEQGMISIVSPLSSSYFVVTAVLAAIFLDERLSWLRWLLVLVVLAGIALASTRDKNGPPVISGVRYGVAALLSLGTAFVLWKPLVSDVGPFMAVVAVRLVSAIILGIYIKLGRPERLILDGKVAVLVAGTALLDSMGFIAFNLGIENHPVSLVTPVAACYPVVTIALAWVLLRERVSRLQMTGIATVLGGIVAFSVVS